MPECGLLHLLSTCGSRTRRLALAGVNAARASSGALGVVPATSTRSLCTLPDTARLPKIVITCPGAELRRDSASGHPRGSPSLLAALT